MLYPARCRDEATGGEWTNYATERVRNPAACAACGGSLRRLGEHRLDGRHDGQVHPRILPGPVIAS
jgi:hypothetical protein